MYAKRFFLISTAAALFAACAGADKSCTMGSYGYDKQFFAEREIPTIELVSAGGEAKVMVMPTYQGRVMTSTAGGDAGDSFGWINYKLIRSGEIDPQFNPVGGEERFWLGPEGGANSWYFKAGDEQVYANWKVPAVIDTDAYEVVEQTPQRVTFTKEFSLTNASGRTFDMGVRRTVELLDRAKAAEVLGIELPEAAAFVAYGSNNTITNRGTEAWRRETGLPSIWMLGLFNPTPTTTVFIPYDRECEGRIVNDEYFGKIPADRLILDDGMLYFRIDGKYRSKLGLPAGSARDIVGSYDSSRQMLTVLKYVKPAGDADYVNSQWGEQEDAFSGDVINAYNDGPIETGTVMGPFYEIETSSPGAALVPGESLSHVQYTMHFQADPATLDGMVRALFGVGIERIVSKFGNRQ